jgi:hypothetical protein
MIAGNRKHDEVVVPQEKTHGPPTPKLNLDPKSQQVGSRMGENG